MQSNVLIYQLVNALKSKLGNILREKEDWELDLPKWQGQGVMQFIPAEED